MCWYAIVLEFKSIRKIGIFFGGGGGIGCWLPVDEILIRILFLLKDIFESSNIVLREVKKLHCKFVMINKCHDLD